MAILKKIKQAFGFSGSEFDDDEEIFGDSTRHQLELESGDSVNRTGDMGTPYDRDFQDTVDTMPSEQIDAIFTTVVNEFNKALPNFISQGIDAETQRKFLYDALTDDCKDFLQRVQSNSLEFCNRRWERERISLNNELNNLRERQKSLEENESDKSKQLLSAERQKRALNERIHDLESQIATLEAEKDQYELETRSLVNKLRVSNMVNEGMEIPDVSTYESRIAELSSQIEKLSCDNETLTGKNDELLRINESLVKNSDELKASNQDAESKVKELTASNTDLSQQLENMKLKIEMTDVMLNDLNTRASTASKDAEAQSAELELLRTKLKDALQRADNTQLELDEARANLEIAASIQTEVERIQETIQTKNQLIGDLTDTVRRREDRINALEAEEASLRRTIESNLLSQAESEKNLRAEIEQLQNQLASGKAKERQRSKRKPSAKISAIDEELDNTDWLVATPPEGTNARTSGVSDSEFGYQEPQRKTPPENSAQMSLW